MAGQGKYTTYVPQNTDRSQFLARLFRGDGTTWVPTVGYKGGGAAPFSAGGGQFYTQPVAAQMVTDECNDILLGKSTNGVIQGDPDFFPKGVDLSFRGGGAQSDDVGALAVPDTAAGIAGSWKNPGDPANSYTPDITGLPPGKTGGADKVTDPKISATDIVPNYVRTADTANPAETAGKIYASLTLGQSMKMGKSGA